MSPDHQILTASKLSLFAGDKALVQHVDLVLKAGESVALMGPSGAGKSLTAQALCGILPKQIHQTGTIQSAGLVAYLPQDAIASLDPLRTVRWHLDQCVPSESSTDIESLLDTLEFLNPRRVLSLYPHQLSGGMARRITLAQCLLSQHRILIVDEPANGLDATAVSTIMAHIQRWAGVERSVLIITHNPVLASQWCSRIYLMDSGLIQETCSTAEFTQGTITSKMGQRYHRAWEALSTEDTL